jgi:16S rRNA (cytosine967-C5)-methyltransferase
MVDLLQRDLGRAAAAGALYADVEPAPLYLWHDPFLGGFDEAIAELEADGARPKASVLPGCIEAQTAAAAVRSRSVKRGACIVTDAAAQLAARVVGPHPGGVVVDLAAGRGTKTAQLQSVSVAAGGAARVYALDLHEFKVKVLAERMARMAVPGVTALVGDATDVSSVAGLPRPGEADAVLLDAPCSGLGTLRRRPEKRWRLVAQEIDALAGLQAVLLAQAASLVRPGGVVVYSTCSLARAENHEVVAAFLGSEAGHVFATRDIRDEVPAEWRRWIGPEGWFQSVPEIGGPDGHFVVALVRKG